MFVVLVLALPFNPMAVEADEEKKDPPYIVELLLLPYADKYIPLLLVVFPQ